MVSWAFWWRRLPRRPASLPSVRTTVLSPLDCCAGRPRSWNGVPSDGRRRAGEPAQRRMPRGVRGPRGHHQGRPRRDVRPDVDRPRRDQQAPGRQRPHAVAVVNDDDRWAEMIRRHEVEKADLELKQAEEMAALAAELGFEGQADGWRRRAAALRAALD